MAASTDDEEAISLIHEAQEEFGGNRRSAANRPSVSSSDSGSDGKHPSVSSPTSSPSRRSLLISTAGFSLLAFLLFSFWSGRSEVKENSVDTLTGVEDKLTLSLAPSEAKARTNVSIDGERGNDASESGTNDIGSIDTTIVPLTDNNLLNITESDNDNSQQGLATNVGGDNSLASSSAVHPQPDSVTGSGDGQSSAQELMDTESLASQSDTDAESLTEPSSGQDLTTPSVSDMGAKSTSLDTTGFTVTPSGDYIHKDYTLLPEDTIADVYNSIPDGYELHPDLFSYSYKSRGKPYENDNQKQSITQQWGSWTLVDDKQRPHVSYDNYPNRDIPRSEFPVDSWQTDQSYLSKFLPESIELVERAIEAMLAEYGHSEKDEPNLSFEERSKMFELSIRDGPFPGRQAVTNGGFTTEFSANMLVKRVLHAVMTEDTFTMVMGGHSSAAGHGNNFIQSFMMQVQRVMEPVFARLGVLFRSHNIGMGGLGTLQNGIASSDMYGRDMDVFIWDSVMTEKSVPDLDIFYRQALNGARRIPALWGAGNTGVLMYYHNTLGVDIAEAGMMWQNGFAGIPVCSDEVQAKTFPNAARYIVCERGYNGCSTHRYESVCWLDGSRDDHTPITKQLPYPGGRAKWHPGNREHTLIGRIHAYNILKPLLTGLKMWRDAADFNISDDAWHLTDFYERVRANLDAELLNNTMCSSGRLPERICQIEMKGRSEMYPRVNPRYTSLRSIVKNELPWSKPNAYKPPDVRHPYIDPPDGEVDVVRIIENGVSFAPELQRIAAVNYLVKDYTQYEKPRHPVKYGFELGKGWIHHGISNPDSCDGSYYSFCGRDDSNACLMSGHNDDRGGLRFDGYSGWLVMHLENVEHGIVMIKVAVDNIANPATQGWCSENDAIPCSDDNQRVVNANDAEYTFEFAINGKITSWPKEEFQEKKLSAQRVVEIWPLLDDDSFPKGDVELAIRLTNCGSFSMILNHVYWA